MTRPLAAGFVLAVAAVLALAPAHAATDKATKSAKTAKSEKTSKSEKSAKGAKASKADKASKSDKTAGGKLIETYGDWTASLAQGKAKTCYALAKPKERSPEGKHDQAYVFIADRPAEKVHNEVSIIPGFPIKEGSAAKARVGKANFDLVAVANAFFMKDASDDGHFVDALKRGGVLVVKAPPLKGPPITDTYSLNGFKQALDRAQKECR